MLVDRALKLSHHKFHESNLEIVKKLLIQNDYPISFINKYIKKRIHCITQDNNNDNKNKRINNFNKFSLVLPFFKFSYSHIKNILKPFDIHIISSANNKLKFIKLGKDKIKKKNTQNTVYEISCLDCDSKYIGQSKRKLCKRISEHKRDIKKFNPVSEIARHSVNSNHSINWKNPKILDIEQNFFSRLFSEMVHIQLSPSNINKKTDTENLQYVYKDFLNYLTHAQ